jgi:ABC-2 type transport system ATP-binding protein
VAIIEVKDLVKKYNEDLTAVKGISFEVYSGEIFGFLGPNGAGKTTTINILCTLLKPTSGKATLNGLDVVHDHNEVREQIGLVFQDPSLDERLTGRENMDFHSYIYGIPPDQRKSRMESVLRMVELYDRKDDRVETYSGGMKRRLEIARGLMHYPKVLFLDEPTIGLDPQTRANIWTYMNQLRVQENITVFLTTHYMDEAENCNRIAVIDYGEIIALGTPEELKGLVGGDLIEIKTDNDEDARRELIERYKVEMIDRPDCLCFEVENGHEFIPNLVRDLNAKVLSVSIRRPTLDDVFLKLTGHDIRPESAEVPMRQLAMRAHRGARR